MRRVPKGRLELSWMGKDSALIPAENGKYDYAWVDPQDPRVQEVRSLEIVEEVGEPEDSLVVVGESADALRSLATIPEWRRKYRGKVKQVYIDPPFNTGQRFTFYEDQLEHSVWLTMMRDRLRLLRPLLAPDASVWVHLDDVEVHRMRVLLDEEFGAENFVGQVTWQKGVHVRNDAQSFSSNTDFVIVYRMPNFKVNKLAPSAEMLARYSAPDGDPEPWQSIASAAPGARTHQGMVHAIEHPVTGEFLYPPVGSCWRYGQAKMREYLEAWGISYRTVQIDDAAKRASICGVEEKEVREGVDALLLDLPLDQAREQVLSKRATDVWPRIFFTKNDATGGMRVKNYPAAEFGRVPVTLWDDLDHNDDAKREIKRLFPGESPFDTPKPETLLQRILEIGSEPGDLVLDFFGGSGTTAAVAKKMGRRFIIVELLEETSRRYLIPRLEMVVSGEDRGGVSTCTERVAVADLPEGVVPEEAQEFTRLLGKFSKTIDIDPAALKALRDAAKTRNDTSTEWSGGGGFSVAQVGPSMYDVEDDSGEVYLSPNATNGVWSQAVAGQLKFTRTPEHPVFAGVRGRQRLAVIDGVVEETTVQTIVQALGADEVAVVVGKGVLPEAEELLKELCPGSRIRRAPDQMFERGVLR